MKQYNPNITYYFKTTEDDEFNSVSGDWRSILYTMAGIECFQAMSNKPLECYLYLGSKLFYHNLTSQDTTPPEALAQILSYSESYSDQKSQFIRLVEEIGIPV